MKLSSDKRGPFHAMLHSSLIDPDNFESNEDGVIAPGRFDS